MTDNAETARSGGEESPTEVGVPMMTACIIAFVIWISLVLLAPVAPWAFVRRLQRKLVPR